ncbi:CDP-diacylglycerol--glycerol-3-phosphate 3-phosphatidyltransferase [uncultured Oceanicoccus sp.]|uniref:CDP-diacylglycerol--glycerol-3-phosphate 3-phosphatidyltransferase n=1 Tax=uncultured Oceanicoccus sp. TaxID=1706381 RepID=UPI0030D9C703
MNIPNALTLFRIALIPVFVLVFYLPYHWSFIASAVIFALAGITDWLDGYLARKLNQSTPFGAFLDPVADKLMVAIALVLLVERFGSWWFTIPAMVIIGREIVISALREWMAELGKRTSVAVSYIGKVKTTFQILAIIVLLAVAPQHSGLLLDSDLLLNGGLILLYISALLTLWSMLVYIRAAWPTFDINSDK